LSVRIRLQRVGRKKVSKYRIVAVDRHARRDGAVLDVLGTYDPQTQPKDFTFKTEKTAYWLNQGAQPSQTVTNLLKQDRFEEKMEALGKGVEPDAISIERKAEKTRKKKSKKNKGGE
jgi:small subunit ribosomal protein S16